MQSYRLLELEVSYARSYEIERKLEFARLRREGRMSRVGLRDQTFARLSDVFIPFVQGLKVRSTSLVTRAATRRPMDWVPSDP